MIFTRIIVGKSDVEDYITQVRNDSSKDGRIKFNKIAAFFDYLEEVGQKGKYPFVRKMTDDLWELRPLKDRFMYAYIDDDFIVVLTHFVKSSQETPKNEIKKAEKRLKIYKERSGSNGNGNGGHQILYERPG